MTILFAGAIGRLPVGGHAWVQMQYLAGLAALGHEVYYLEDCGPESWVYNWETQQMETTLDYPAGYVRDCLAPIGFGERWMYRAGRRSRGMPVEQLLEVCARADLLIIWAVPLGQWRPEYDRPRRRAFIDVDPGFTQISLANGDGELAGTTGRCEHLFTIAQRMGAPDCPIPDAGRRWHRTVSPVFLEEWPVAGGGDATHFTSVMQWRGFRDVVFNGVPYGQKDREFPKFIDLPRRVRQPFRIALTGAAPENLTARGWDVVEGWAASRTPDSYRRFIQESRAEFGVAKHGYVLMRGGWFSDRTACYLACGRPALLEDTGLADWLPVGEGVVTFRDLDGAVRGVEAVNGDYERHRRGARRIAEEYFDTAKVLPKLLEIATG